MNVSKLWFGVWKDGNLFYYLVYNLMFVDGQVIITLINYRICYKLQFVNVSGSTMFSGGVLSSLLADNWDIAIAFGILINCKSTCAVMDVFFCSLLLWMYLFFCDHYCFVNFVDISATLCSRICDHYCFVNIVDISATLCSRMFTSKFIELLNYEIYKV